MTIVAHRGITANAPDNSRSALEAVALANRAGVPIGIEVDVRAARDGLVLSHDAIQDNVVLSHNTVSRLLRSPGEFITLDDALAVLADVAMVNLELKEPATVHDVVRIVHRHCGSSGRTPQSFVLSSFDPWTVAQIKRSAPEFRSAILVDASVAPEQRSTEREVFESLVGATVSGRVAHEHVRSCIDLLDATGADLLCSHWSDVSHGLLDSVVERGKQTSVWTVNDAQLMKFFNFDSRVGDVITDLPHLVHPGLLSTRKEHDFIR